MHKVVREFLYRREIEEIDFLERMRDVYQREKDELSDGFGWYRNQDEIKICERVIGHHNSMIAELKTKIYGGTK